MATNRMMSSGLIVLQGHQNNMLKKQDSSNVLIAVPLPEAYVTLADLVKHFRFLLICMVFQQTNEGCRRNASCQLN
jgi:hypothetical protein